MKDLTDHRLSGRISRYVALFSVFLSPLLSLTDNASNIYFVFTQTFIHESLRDAFIFFIFGSLVVQSVVWTFRLMNKRYIKTKFMSVQQYITYDFFQLSNRVNHLKGCEQLLGFVKLFIFKPTFLMAVLVIDILRYIPTGLLHGIGSELSIIPILLQYRMGQVISKRQIDTFKFNMENFYSLQAS